jgi:hypothetical protein
MKDHEDVAALFERFETAAASDREDIADGICTLLTVHAACEEEFVYPAAHEVIVDDRLVFEAEIEQRSVQDLVAQIEVLAVDDPRFEPAVKVLSDYFRHHVQEEERELFPRLRKSDLDLESLAQSISARKAELLDGALLPGQPEFADDDGDEEDPDVPAQGRTGYPASH